MNTLIVVGEKFKAFAEKNEDVLTVHEFERFVWSGEIANVKKIILGQGVQLDDIKRTINTMQKNHSNKIQKIINLNDIYHQNNRYLQKLVHKRKKENILITSPEKQDNGNYNSKLILQDSSELLCDHQTGQHIQGMILIEAARQAMIATTEKYFLRESGISMNEKYFTLTSLNVSFLSFVFPLPVTISLKALSHKITKYGKFTGEYNITFNQNEIKTAEISFIFSVYDLNYITQKEGEQASMCHHNYLESI
ncbi:AfsA-related hotdog domain-containing protein [Xenorhabdus stockiae]|uniref:AfsA-related hotdog domain-containing protein n=1 Tax=Xenorhabdus stockiae TaxID=351614 RepID=UPI003CF92BB0